MIFVPYYFRNFSFQIFLIDFVQKQFSYIGAKHRKNQHCGFQKKSNQAKKVQAVGDEYSEMQKIKGNGDSI